MRPTRQLLHLLLLLTCIFLLCIQTSAVDNLEKGQNLTDGKTLVSAGGTFTLGFFSRGASTKRYLGIWFSESNDTVYWVANRDNPLGDRSGILVVNGVGNLVLLDRLRRMKWSSDFGGSASVPAARLLESGNLVVRNGSSDANLWQSFDHPSDTLLPGMKLGKNSWSGAKWELRSWRSADDPSPGDYSRTLETTQLSGLQSLQELVIWQHGVKMFRTGPWNGLYFNGYPEPSTYSQQYKLHVTTSATETTYGYTALPGAPLTRVVLNHTGAAERHVWDASSRSWNLFYRGPKDECDDYARCGPFGLCNAGAASRCSCVPGFRPVSPSAWQFKRYEDGCRRDAGLDCSRGTSTDRFKMVTEVKLPDTQNASVDTSITMEECKTRCHADCSCLAYAAAYTQEGDNGTGCVIWTDTIVDLRLVEGERNLYLRLSKSEFAESVDGRDDRDGGKRFPILLVVAPVASAVTVLVAIFLTLWLVIRRIIDKEVNLLINLCGDLGDVPQNQAMAVRSVNLATIKHVTGNFSRSNLIGKGRFGAVYKAQLAEGRFIAVKRLNQSALTRKSKRYFASEVEAMAGLHYRSLVRLLAYCNQCKERILVYEYMQNKSLYFNLFDMANALPLDWPKRLEIIETIAHGVAYLHGEGSVHGNLKPGNILLDHALMAKIADFGTAKLFGIEQMGPGQTIVVSPAYAPPDDEQPQETALKSDVYSFGVIILETLTGQRNGNDHGLLRKVREMDMHQIEEFLKQTLPLPPEFLQRLQRFIETALHCVEELPGNRPTMTAVVSMLAGTLQ